MLNQVLALFIQGDLMAWRIHHKRKRVKIPLYLIPVETYVGKKETLQ